MQMSGGSVVWILDADSGKFTQAMIQAERQADQTGKNVDRSLSNASSNVASAFSNIGKQISNVAWNSVQNGASIAGSALFALGARGINSANELQSLQLSMNGLTKSMTLGAKAMAEAYKYALSSPFQLSSVAAATKTMIAFGLNVDEATGALKTLGNISITTGIPIEAMANIFGRVSAQGRLMGGDIQQLTENGVAILPQLQKQLGKTAEEVRKMASDGEISANQFRTALDNLVDPSILAQLENTLPRQLDRLNGSVRQMAFALVGASVDVNDGFKLLDNSIGQSVVNITRNLANAFRSKPILDALASLGQTAVPLFDAIARSIEPMIVGMTKFINIIADMGPLLLPILGLIIGRLGFLFGQFPIIGELLQGFTGPMGLALGLIAALVAYSPELRSGIAEGFKIISDTLHELSPVFKEMLDGFKEASGQLGASLKPVVIALAEAFSAVLKALVPIVPILGETLVTAVIAIAPALVIAAQAIEAIANAFNNLDPNVQKFLVNAALLALVAKPIVTTFKPVTDVINKFTGALGGLFKGKLGGGAAGNAIGSTIEAIFKPLANPTVLKGAAGAGLIGVALAAITFGINAASQVKINFANLGIVVASIAVLTLIFTLLGKLGPMAIVGGIAAAAIGAGLYVAAEGISRASKLGNEIQIPGLAIMMGALVVVGAILALTAQFAVFAAIGAIASAVIGGGLLVAAIALAEVSKIAPRINAKNIIEFSKTVAIVSVILGIVAAFAVYGAITAVANMIIAGGLLVAAIALVETSKQAANIVPSNIDKLLDVIVKTNLILAALSLFSTFTAIGALINTVITGGVLVAAIQLRKASEVAGGIQPYNLKLLSEALKYVAELETGGILNNLKNMVNTGIMVKIAEQVRSVVSVFNSTGSLDINKIQKLNDAMKKLSDIKTNGVFEAVKDMISTGALLKVAENVKSITEAFIGIKPVSTDSVDKLNQMMNKLSQIKLEGGFFFDNRGEKAELLATVAQKMSEIARSLNSMPALGGNVSKNIQGVRDAIYQIGQVNEVGNMENKEKIVGLAQSILNKMSGLATTLNALVSLGGNSIAKIQGVRNAIYELGQINEVGNMADKELIVAKAQSILNKMTGMATTLNGMVSLGGNSLEKIATLRNVIYQLGQINEVGNMAAKEQIVGLSQSILNKMSGMAQTINALPAMNPESLGKISTIRNAIYQVGQINQVEGMENKVSIVAQTQQILTSMQQFATSLNGLPIVAPEKITAMYTIRNAIYQAAQVNQNVGDIANKVMIVNQATSILRGMVTFAQTLASLPDAGDKSGVLGALINSINQVATKITASAPQFQSAGAGLITALAAGVNSGRGAVAAAGTAIQGAVYSAIQARFGDMYQQGYFMGMQTINGVRSVAGQGNSAGHAIQSAVYAGIQGKFGDMYVQGQYFTRKFFDGVRSITGEGYSIGANATQGFINGALSRSAYSAGTTIASQYLQGLKDRGRQGSPWKETASIGVFAGQGLIEGIKSTENALYRNATSMVDNLLGIMDVGTVGINPQLQINGMDANMADIGGLSRSVGSFDYNGNSGGHIENHIGTIEIASEVDAQNWLEKLTRDDEVTRGGMTSAVTA